MKFKNNWPQFFWIALALYDMGYSIAMNGKPFLPLVHNPLTEIPSILILTLLLLCGGFFTEKKQDEPLKFYSATEEA